MLYYHITLYKLPDKYVGQFRNKILNTFLLFKKNVANFYLCLTLRALFIHYLCYLFDHYTLHPLKLLRKLYGNDFKTGTGLAEMQLC